MNHPVLIGHWNQVCTQYLCPLRAFKIMMFHYREAVWEHLRSMSNYLWYIQVQCLSTLETLKSRLPNNARAFWGHSNNLTFSQCPRTLSIFNITHFCSSFLKFLEP